MFDCSPSVNRQGGMHNIAVLVSTGLFDDDEDDDDDEEVVLVPVTISSEAEASQYCPASQTVFLHMQVSSLIDDMSVFLQEAGPQGTAYSMSSNDGLLRTHARPNPFKLNNSSELSLQQNVPVSLVQIDVPLLLDPHLQSLELLSVPSVFEHDSPAQQRQFFVLVVPLSERVPGV